MIDDRYRPTRSTDSPPTSTLLERLASVAAELLHLRETTRSLSRRQDKLEDRFERFRQEQLEDRIERKAKEAAKLQAKEARKGALAAFLACVSVGMFLMAAWNFTAPLRGAPSPNSAQVLR